MIGENFQFRIANCNIELITFELFIHYIQKQKKTRNFNETRTNHTMRKNIVISVEYIDSDKILYKFFSIAYGPSPYYILEN